MEYLKENREKIIGDLLECLSIASVSQNRVKTEEALDYVLSLAESMGMESHKLLDGRVGTVEIGQGTETLGILVHIDVVDEGNRDLWICDPFKGQVIDGKIYGRGALDDKGPLIASLHAMKAAMDEERPFTKKVRMIIGTQEEAEWSDMDEYVKKYELPDYGFTPDGEFPICNIEKGCVDAVIRFPIFESNDNGEGVFIQKIEGGTASNVIPGSCKVWMSNGRQIQTFGKAAHSSRPDSGKNAILLMAEKIASGKLAGDAIAEKMNMIQRRFHDIYGSGIGIYSKNEYYNGEYIHRNVVSPTMIRTEKGYLELTLNVRFSYESTAEEIIAAIEKLCDEEGGYVESCTSLPAIYVDRHEPYLKKLAEAYEDQTDFSNEFSLAYGGSYAKVMKRMVSWGPILPGMEDTCHEENECIKIDDLITNFRIYYDAIMSIAKSEESFV